MRKKLRECPHQVLATILMVLRKVFYIFCNEHNASRPNEADKEMEPYSLKTGIMMCERCVAGCSGDQSTSGVRCYNLSFPSSVSHDISYFFPAASTRAVKWGEGSFGLGIRHLAMHEPSLFRR